MQNALHLWYSLHPQFECVSTPNFLKILKIEWATGLASHVGLINFQTGPDFISLFLFINKIRCNAYHFILKNVFDSAFLFNIPEKLFKNM